MSPGRQGKRMLLRYPLHVALPPATANLAGGSAIRRYWLGLAVALLLGAGPALAQDVSGLRNEVNRLRQDVSDLQRQLSSQGGRVPARGGEAPSNFRQVGSESAVTQLQVRIEQIDTEMRALTGQIEQANFQISQIGQKLDKLMADVDYRLSVIEGRPGGGAAPAGGTAPGLPPRGQMDDGLDDGPGRLNPPPPAVATLEDSMKARTAPGAASGIGAALPSGSPEEQYAHAFGLLRTGDYAAAATGMESFLRDNPGHELAGNAAYWLGETWYVQKEYSKAANYFLEGFQKYPKSRKGPDNLLKLGMTLAALDHKDEACQTLKEISKNYPQAPEKVTQKATLERERLRCK